MGRRDCVDILSRQITTGLRYLRVEEIVFETCEASGNRTERRFNLDGAQSFHQILDTADRRERSSAWFFLAVLWMQVAAVVAIGLLIFASFIH
ncbi:hypothetical protein HDF09_001044 [Edaphobacter lichenicola]|uniref:Uncharacterized protein n=1 Tax=Tunturiibacter empetritectus TaxID=3069691 RepID=A0A7W8MRP0_9BACT|nr:hypothetical protein [Edaphobacter lichenicola]